MKKSYQTSAILVKKKPHKVIIKQFTKCSKPGSFKSALSTGEQFCFLHVGILSMDYRIQQG
jgi:hypothetical protein